MPSSDTPEPQYSAVTATEHEHSLLTTDPEKIASLQAQIVHRMELLAEKPQLTVHKVSTGQVHIKKVVRQRTVEIPVTLTEEVLVIEYRQTAFQSNTTQATTAERTGELQLNDVAKTRPTIILNGETIILESHQSIEIPLYTEQAVIHKNIVVTEQIDIGKTVQKQQQQYPINLQHEELEITAQASGEPVRTLSR